MEDTEKCFRQKLYGLEGDTDKTTGLILNSRLKVIEGYLQFLKWKSPFFIAYSCSLP